MPAEKEQQQDTKPTTRVRGILRDRGGHRGGKRGTGRLASLGGNTEKMVFKPKAAPRRPNRETPATSPIIKQEIQEPARPPKTLVRKRKPELIQRVAGPFSQGPATIGNGQRSMGSTILGNDRGGNIKSEYGGAGDADGVEVELRALDLNDVYEQEHELVVQTEEEAIERAELAKQTGELDYQTGQIVASLVGLPKSEDYSRMMVFQMPPELPVFEDTVKSEDGEESQMDGRIGSLVVFKSGAVKMRLGEGILMDVSRGAECDFMRGILAHQQKDAEHSAYLLGNVECQFLCSPDLESVI